MCYPYPNTVYPIRLYLYMYHNFMGTLYDQHTGRHIGATCCERGRRGVAAAFGLLHFAIFGDELC